MIFVRWSLLYRSIVIAFNDRMEKIRTEREINAENLKKKKKSRVFQRELGGVWSIVREVQSLTAVRTILSSPFLGPTVSTCVFHSPSYSRFP